MIELKISSNNVGYVGIGTSSPAGLFDVGPSTAANGLNGSSVFLYAQNGATNAAFGGGNIIMQPATGGPSGPNGNIGIGFTVLPQNPKADLETKAVLKLAIEANRNLAELKGVGALIPNQSILLRGIVVQEAKVSSEIENIITTNDSLYQAMSQDSQKFDPHTKEVLSYEAALWHGVEYIKKKPIGTNLFVELVNIIKSNTANIRSTPGTVLRDSRDEVIYTPPTGESVIRDLLSNLEKFVHTEASLDPLIKMAVMHYQFEAIHPFTDGNGRTGRIMNILYLMSEGLLDLPVLYLSRYIIKHNNSYYQGLRDVTEKQQWEQWVLFNLSGIAETAKSTKEKVIAIKSLLEKTNATVKAKLPKIYSKELVEAVFQLPYCKIKFLVDAGLGIRDTASLYVKELERIGILKSDKVGREVLYINQPLYDLLIS